MYEIVEQNLKDVFLVVGYPAIGSPSWPPSDPLLFSELRFAPTQKPQQKRRCALIRVIITKNNAF